MSLTDEEKLAKIDLICEKTGVSRADARAALELCDYDTLDAVILLERQGKTEPRTAHASTASAPGQGSDSSRTQMVEAQIIYENDTRRTSAEEKVNRFFAAVQNLLRRSLDIRLVATRNGRETFSFPLLLLIILLIVAFWIVLPLLVVSLFFDYRYHFEGIGAVTVDLNDLSQKASDGAERIKREAKDLHDQYDRKENSGDNA